MQHSVNRWLGAWLVVFFGLTSACAGSTTKHGQDAGGDGGLGDGGGSSATAGSSAGTIPDGGVSAPLLITPADPVIKVVNGKAQTLDFKATAGGLAALPVWSISRAEIGTIDSKTGHFVSGSVGGQATITADTGKTKVATTITVSFVTTDNGAGAGGACGVGGCGGVGGEGGGPAVTSAQKKLLDAKPVANAKLVWLYPYDQTVWPLGLLAPLLQWDFDPATPADAIKLELTSQYYTYTGYFARPKLLTAGAPFVRHPIPQTVWDAATRSSARASLKVQLTVLAGKKTYGPITETWPVAGTSLKGTVYYQSYGTELTKNNTGAIGGDGSFGGATLAISAGDTSPSLVAGSDGDGHECRVCHVISADGSRMIVQHGIPYPYLDSSSYALNLKGYPETPYAAATAGVMGWAGLSPDGKLALSNTGPLEGGANNGSASSQLLNAATGAPLASKGLTTFVTRAAMPVFSPDGTKVAFTFYEGPGNTTIGAGDESKLVVMSFDVKTKTFSKPILVYQGKGGARPGWPSFMPTGDRLVFQVDLPSGTNRGSYLSTWRGNRGELWWVDLNTRKAYPLEHANGKSKGAQYLPIGANNHDDDTTLQYEPTVSPIAAGGYAWVVFTSRRMYGNVATIDPTWSDPRDHDLTQTPTPKKLWVSAIDLPSAEQELQTKNVDPSHPPFYLPAQELLAGNSRGYWVPEPCRADGKTCDSGDQCCGGYCASDAKLKKNVCGGKPPVCAVEYDKCTTSADCCTSSLGEPLVCIGGRCSVQLVQ